MRVALFAAAPQPLKGWDDRRGQSLAPVPSLRGSAEVHDGGVDVGEHLILRTYTLVLVERVGRRGKREKYADM